MVDAGGYDADLGPQFHRVTWDTLPGAVQWLRDLTDEWSWADLGEARHTANSHAWSLISTPLGAIRAGLEMAVESGSQSPLSVEQRNAAFDTAAQQLRKLFVGQPWLLASAPEHSLVSDVRSRKGDEVAAAVLALLLKVDVRSGQNAYVIAQASVEHELFLRGAPKRLDWETKAYAELIERMSEDQAAHVVSLNNSLAQHNACNVAFNGSQEAWEKKFADSQDTRAQDWRAAYSAAKVDLENIKSAYDKHMALAAPVEYWQSKQTRHFKWMCATGVLTAIAMILAGWLLHCELTEVAAKATASAATGGAKQDGVVGLLSALTTWRLGSFILLATLAFWILRLLVRVFLSNMHLENDAAERVTMVKTYLAFTRHGQLTGDPDNLKAILAALFRPTGDGIVKDDGAPPGLYELLTKLK